MRQVSRAALLAVAFALGGAMGNGPAHAGDEAKLNVSAFVLPRTACSIASGAGENLRPTLRCNGSDAVTTYRVSSDRSPQATFVVAARGETGSLTVTATDTGVLTIDL